MNLERIQEMWQVDSVINEFDLDTESLKIPQLHQKYYKLSTDFKFIFKENQFKYKSLLKDKYKYYSGKAPKEDYKEKPFDLKLLKTDIPMFLEADEEMQKCEMKMSYAEECINYIESILKMISNRTYQIKNAIEHRRFEAGG
jgi:hypothetical protein